MRSEKREVAIYLRAINRMGAGVRQAASEMKAISAAGDRVFRRVVQVGAAAFAALAAGAAGVGAAFEQAMANTSSMFITAAKSAAELDGWTRDLARRAREIGAATAFSATEAANAMYSLASGGLKANQVIAATGPVLELAGATLNDMGATAETVMSTMVQFGLKAHQTSRITNVFAAGIQNSTLNMQRLTDAMVYAGPVAAALGMSVEETTAALALLHNAGLKGSMAGTGLRMMFARLLDAGGELKKILGGVSLEKDGLGAVLAILQKANLSAAQMSSLFGERAFAAVAALTKAGKKGFDDMTRALTGTTAAQSMYKRQMDTVQSQLKILRSGIEETFLATFDKIQPSLRKMLGAAQRFVEETRPIVVGMFEATVKAANDAAPYVRAFINDMARGLRELRPAMHAVRELTVDLFSLAGANVSTIASLTRVTAGLTVATWALSKAANALVASFLWIRAHPIALVFTLLAAGIGLAIDKMGGFQAAWVNVQFGVRKGIIWIQWYFKALWADLRMTGDLFNALAGYWRDFWQKIAEIGEIGGGLFKRIMGAIKDTILDPFGPSVWERVQSEVAAGIASIAEVASREGGSYFDDVSKNHAHRLAQAKSEMEQQLRELRKWHKDALFDALYGDKPLGIDGDGGAGGYKGPKLSLFDSSMMYDDPVKGMVSSVADSSAEIFDIWEETQAGLVSVSQSAWNSIIDSHSTGTRKWKELWKSSSEFVWGLIGKTVLAQLTGNKVVLVDTITKNELETESNVKTAASGFFKAYAGLPFAGQVLALASILAMTTFLAKMHTGGMIGGSGGRGSYRERMFMGQDGEYVMPVAQTRANYETLEAMRRGMRPALSAAGRGGPSVTVHVNVPKGSLLIANDHLAVRRLSTIIADDIENRIAKQYRDGA